MMCVILYHLMVIFHGEELVIDPNSQRLSLCH